MADPTHTVLVPAYNAAETVGEAIRSVTAQTTESFEVIAVDDGSSDATPELLDEMSKGDPRIRVVRQPNAGPSAARNAAIRRASGSYLTFLDSDDLLMPRYLEAMEEIFRRNPDAGLAYARAWVLDEAAGGGRVRRGIWPPPGYVTGSALAPDDPVVALASGNYVGAVQTATREAVERVGGLDVDLRQAEDYDLWLRIAIAGFGIVSGPEALAVVRNRAGSLSKDELELAEGVRAVCRRLLSEYEVSEEARAAAAAQLERTDHMIEVLDGSASVRGAIRRVRLALGRIKRRLLIGRLWYPEPPPDVAEAFPELVADRAA
ncbi:MAG: glycosyltransferase family 2 protein [Solirubrobacterales bacterium]